jgi:hypothetical protein
MALNLSSIEAELDQVVATATTYVDLADKFADEIAVFAKAIPVVGPDVAPVVALLDEVTKALNALNAALHP